MRRFIHSIPRVAGLLLLVLTVLLGGVDAQPKSFVNISTGQVTGKISNSEGQPLGGAAVNFGARFRGMQISVFTAENGSFAADLSVGVYQVTAELRGYLNQTRTAFEVTSGNNADLGLVLNPIEDGFDQEGQISGAESLSLLPVDARKTLINTCAGGCHSPGVIGGKRMTRAGWTKLLERMNTHGSGRGGPEDLAAQVDILITYFGTLMPVRVGATISALQGFGSFAGPSCASLCAVLHLATDALWLVSIKTITYN